VHPREPVCRGKERGSCNLLFSVTLIDVKYSKSAGRDARTGGRRYRTVVRIGALFRHNSYHKGNFMAKNQSSSLSEVKGRQSAPLITPTDLGTAASADIAGGMNAILADVFALYLKTKNFHWHMSGPHFRDYHLLLDEQADQLYAMTDPIAERIRKTGGSTLRSIGHIARIQRIKDNDAEYVAPNDMLAELREDNQTLAARLREVHDMVDEHRDIATASLIENWIDETERRTWFLFESSRRER
jgi:starvation-inducible DNA-binding protein